ncbi:MAG: methyl-accepting chemotaxis protein [Proteobacteria bacterium]|nr:methyl-accepting chemotaxis protein [Pseudomonadota bacterium]
MKNTLSRLLLALTALWLVQPAGPIVSVFYCMSTTPEQKVTFMIWAVFIWLLLLAMQSLILSLMYKPLGRVLTQIIGGSSCNDDQLITLAKNNSAFPLRISIMYCLFIFAAALCNFFVYRAYGIGNISSFSIWGACLAGAIACPFMVLGTINLIMGKSTEYIVGQISKRSLEYTATRINIYPKLVSCFIALSIGLAIWLGFAGFYTGVNQTIEEIKYGDAHFLKAIVNQLTTIDQTKNETSIIKSMEADYPDRLFFIVDPSGKLLAGSQGETLDIPRWEGLQKDLATGFGSGSPGSLYENVNERVISWAPLGKTEIIGTLSYLKYRLNRYDAFYIWSGFFIIVGFSVGLTLGLTNVLATSKSITRAADVLRDLAEGEGDLTTRLAITSEDEVGDFAHRFNTFTDKLYLIIKSIVEKSQEVRASSLHFSELSRHMNTGIIELRQNTVHVSGQASVTSQELSEVSSGCDLTANTVNQVSMAADEMAASVKEVAQKSEEARQIAQSAVTTSKNASEKIAKLGSSAKDIDKVTEVITEISEQINLLALNATIESARAGEAGKGFAVVANEIKALARQTAEATQEIKERINGIQNSTEETVHDMSDISQVINSVNEIVFSIAGAVEEQSVTTREIAKNIAQVSSGVSDVNKGVAKSSESSQVITSQMEGVNTRADDISQNSAKVDEGARNLLSISELLNEQLSKFKL